MSISKKELQILYELESDSSQTYQSISKKCQLGKENVHYYVKKMEQDGLIRGYYALTDKGRMGLVTCRAYIKQRRLDQKLEEGIIRFLNSDPDVWGFGRTSGEMDFVLGVSKKSYWEIGEFFNTLYDRFGPDIQRLDPQLFLEYEEYAWAHGSKGERRKSLMISRSPKAEYDAVDEKILRILEGDARIPRSELAARLGESERVVRYRIVRMEKNGIIAAYGCDIDYSKLGLNRYKVDFYLSDRSLLLKLRRYVTSMPECVYFVRTVHHSDFEFDVLVKDVPALISLVRSISDRFPGVIREFKYYHMLVFYK